MSTRLIFLSRQISRGTALLPIPGGPQRKSGCTASGLSSAFSMALATDLGLICFISFNIYSGKFGLFIPELSSCIIGWTFVDITTLSVFVSLLFHFDFW
jgi:hypothetical protein